MSGVLSAADAAVVVLDAVRRDCGIAIATVIETKFGIEPGSRLAVIEDGAVLGDFGSVTDAVAAAAQDVLRAGGTRKLSLEGITVFIDVVLPAHHLVIVGAGHIAVPLAELAVLLGYRVSVLDDREEFATGERFPASAAVQRVDFADPFAGVTIGPRSSVVLVTRAHRYDFDCLLRILEMPVQPKYIGMIGSRRRVRAAFHAVLTHGVARQKLARVYAPVGIDIGAETPAEIAVSIAAEMIAVHSGAASDEMLSARERVLDRLLKDA